MSEENVMSWILDAHHISAGRNRRRSSSVSSPATRHRRRYLRFADHRQHERPWHSAHLRVQYRRLRFRRGVFNAEVNQFTKASSFRVWAPLSGSMGSFDENFLINTSSEVHAAKKPLSLLS
jgi:hypothetical protein